jgi:hypothetical protein
MEQTWHIKNNFSCGWNLADNLFGVGPVPSDSYGIKDEKLNTALGSLLGFPLLPKNKKSLRTLRRQLMLCDSSKERNALIKGYLKIAIWPSLTDLENIKFPPIFFPLYFITKRFRFLFRKK